MCEKTVLCRLLGVCFLLPVCEVEVPLEPDPDPDPREPPDSPEPEPEALEPVPDLASSCSSRSSSSLDVDWASWFPDSLGLSPWSRQKFKSQKETKYLSVNTTDYSEVPHLYALCSNNTWKSWSTLFLLFLDVLCAWLVKVEKKTKDGSKILLRGL